MIVEKRESVVECNGWIVETPGQALYAIDPAGIVKCKNAGFGPAFLYYSIGNRGFYFLTAILCDNSEPSACFVTRTYMPGAMPFKSISVCALAAL